MKLGVAPLKTPSPWAAEVDNLTAGPDPDRTTPLTLGDVGVEDELVGR